MLLSVCESEWALAAKEIFQRDIGQGGVAACRPPLAKKLKVDIFIIMECDGLPSLSLQDSPRAMIIIIRADNVMNKNVNHMNLLFERYLREIRF